MIGRGFTSEMKDGMEDADESSTGSLPADDGRAANDNHSTACEPSSHEAEKSAQEVVKLRVWLHNKFFKGWVTKEVIALSRLAMPIVSTNYTFRSSR